MALRLRTFLLAPFLRWMKRLRYPTLFKGALALTLFWWVVPDPIPFLDEILFTALTLGLASWKKERSERQVAEPVMGDVSRVRSAPLRDAEPKSR